MDHVHKQCDFTAINPSGTTGYQHCRCGATRRVEKGKADVGWHTCKLCTHPWGLDAKEPEATNE